MLSFPFEVAYRHSNAIRKGSGMTLKDVKARIPEWGRDIQLNLDSVLSAQGSPGLTGSQVWGVALACSYAVGSEMLTEAILHDGKCDDATVAASKSAASIMAMNNVYFRAIHLMNDPGLVPMPAGLSMDVMAEPGIGNIDFVLMGFGISAIGGCGVCMTSKVAECRQASVSDAALQSTLRIAAVINAANRALRIAGS
jgi:lipoyl-dependent peroxiredoxin subunit D